jgi:hypothetical protein
MIKLVADALASLKKKLAFGGKRKETQAKLPPKRPGRKRHRK